MKNQPRLSEQLGKQSAQIGAAVNSIDNLLSELRGNLGTPYEEPATLAGPETAAPTALPEDGLLPEMAGFLFYMEKRLRGIETNLLDLTKRI